MPNTYAVHEIRFIVKRNAFISKVKELLYLTNRDNLQHRIKVMNSYGDTYIVYRELAAMNGEEYASRFKNKQYTAPDEVCKRAEKFVKSYIDTHSDIIPTV